MAGWVVIEIERIRDGYPRSDSEMFNACNDEYPEQKIRQECGEDQRTRDVCGAKRLAARPIP
jgi:hypothetical protein